MHIDRERGCCRISFEHTADLRTLQQYMENCNDRVAGLIGGELLREGDHFVLCVHHQESLKVYLEHEIFDLNAFLVFAERLRRLLGEMNRNQLDIYDGVWDVDCIFVGTGPDDLSFVHIPGLRKGGDDSVCRIGDLLAVVSLRVYETDLQALQVLSNVVGAFSTWEDTVLLQGKYSEEPFAFAQQQLTPFCPDPHPLVAGVRRLFSALTEARKEESTLNTKLNVLPARRRKVRLQLEGLGKLKGRNLCLDLDTHFTHDGTFLVGRESTRVDFLIPYPIISRLHASFSYDKGEWILRDYHSANGTFIDDMRITAEGGYPLIQGARIFFGHKEIGFCVKKV